MAAAPVTERRLLALPNAMADNGTQREERTAWTQSSSPSISAQRKHIDCNSMVRRPISTSVHIKDGSCDRQEHQTGGADPKQDIREVQRECVGAAEPENIRDTCQDRDPK